MGVMMIAAAVLTIGALVFVRWRYLGDSCPNADVIIRMLGTLRETRKVKGGDNEAETFVNDRL